MLTVIRCLIYNEEVMGWLLDLGANVNASSRDAWWTTVHAAAVGASTPLFTRLIALGADISRAPGMLALAASAHRTTLNRIPVIQTLLDRGADTDEYQGSSISFEGQNFCELLVWGRKDALHHAVQRGSKELVEFLLEKGADSSIQTRSLTSEKRWIDVEQLADICGHAEIRDMLTLHAKMKEAAVAA
ncbi:hypothetical protein P154DRAFT_577237 [Amniculicola lignicola CBS 123094]|uniref:Uncharacterized protein n=1 Tax=Amniculicola lignicola CBS 123094 TaxID=1392246 RepID=A0A6A5WDW1_9PLEO|nr:hypothetical protein P154DRAFT_577237 [Amniculicola lignicola CBS 123094]